MDKIVALCKRRGLIFPASEIYGGIANTYDYGHYGVLLKRNVVDAWWDAMLQERDDIVALDSRDHPAPQDLGVLGPPRGLHRPAGRLQDLQAALPRRPPRRGPGRPGLPARHPLRPQALQAPGRDRGVRPHRAARVQPHVRDGDRPRPGRRPARLPAARDRAGHLPGLQDGPDLRPPPAAVRHRAGRQVVSQRDHARQLHLPHAGVRADGDGVLRAAGPGGRVVRALEAGALRLVHRTSACAPTTCACATTTPTSCRTTRPAPPTSSTCSRSAGRSWRASPTAATST